MRTRLRLMGQIASRAVEVTSHRRMLFVALLSMAAIVLLPSASRAQTCSNTSLGGGWTCISFASVYTGSATNSLSAGTFANNPPSGSLIVVGMQFKTTSACSATDTLGNTFTTITSSVQWGNSQRNCMFYAVTSSTGADNVTCAASGSTYMECDAVVLTGNAASPLDQTCTSVTNATGGSGSNNQLCSASITPSASGELIIGDMSDNSGTVTAGTNFTMMNGSIAYMEYYMQATAGAITPSWTNASSGVVYGAEAASFKSAGSGSTYSISGAVSPASSGSGTTLTLSGAGSGNQTADSSGNYTFSGLAPGSYTVTPSKSGFSFSPNSAPVTISNSDFSAVDFTAATSTCSNTSLGGGWTCVSFNSDYTGSSANSLSAGAFGNNPPSGSLIVVGMQHGGTAACSASDTLGNTFTKINSVGWYSGSNTNCMLYAVSSSAGADTVTCAANGSSFMECDAAVFTGNSASPVDQTCTSVTNATSGSGSNNQGCSASITPTQNNELVIGETSDNSGTVTAGTNFTLINGSVAYMEYYMQPTAAAVTPTWTNSNSGGVFGAEGVSFRAATAPTISSLSPANGAVGTSVTITGSNFGSSQGSSTVTFYNGVPANPTSWSSDGTSIVAPVPAGATTGNVVVTVGGVASNPKTFTVNSGGSTISHIQQWGNFQSGSGVSLTASSGSNLTAGNLAVCGVSASGSWMLTASDSEGNTWNTAFGPTTNSSLGFTQQIVYASNVKGGAETVTMGFSGSVTYIRIHCHEVSGVNTVDQSTGQANSGSSMTSGNVTTTQASQFLFGYGIDNSGNPTVGSGWSAGITEGSELDEYQIVSSTGAYAATYTGDGGQYIDQIATFYINGGSGGGSYSISGTVSPSSNGAGTTLTLSGAGSGTQTADASGNYTFTGLANGTYTVTPSNNGFSFSPTSRNSTISNANVTGVNFTSTALTYSISGTVSPASSGTGTTLTLSGAGSGMTTADSSGNYGFSGLANGAYTITPSKSGLSFTPATQNATISAANAGGVNFVVNGSGGGGSGTDYTSGYTYNSAGQLLGFKYGDGVVASFGYSTTRPEMTGLSYTQGTSVYFNLTYWYHGDSTYCNNGSAGNNGQIQCINDNVDSGRSVSYAYDQLSRLSTAVTGGSSNFPAWGLQWTYDRFGNRLSQTVAAGTAPSFGPVSVDVATNRPTGYTYDVSGNLTSEPASPPSNYAYDAENRMTSFSGGGGTATYTYDGNGLRIEKAVNGGTTTVYIYSGNQVIAEYDNGAPPSSPSREYIYDGSRLVATATSSTLTYHHEDQLSVRLSTDGTSGSPTYGQIIGQQGHFPYGKSWYTQNATTKYFFTTYENDNESGNAYALARFYNPRPGRFMSPDPVPGDITDPQTLDLYTYVHNDPINLMDPTGLCPPFGEDCGGGPSFPCVLCSLPSGGGGDNGGGFPIPPDNAPTPPNLHNTGLGQGSPNPFNGETNGIPNGMQIPSLGLPGIFLPDDPGCDFGGCGFTGRIDPILLPPWFKIQIWVFDYAGLLKGKWWSSIGPEGCSKYSSSGRGDLAWICGLQALGNGPKANSVRGCLLEFYNSDFYNGKGAYENHPDDPRQHSAGAFYDFWNTYGVAAHSYCFSHAPFHTGGAGGSW